ncbi:MAG: family 16 glycoside hydrolase [Rubripirellula sp.]
MNRIYPIAFFSLLVTSFPPPAQAENPDELIKRAKLIFGDDFNRNEDDEVNEQVGNGWVTNSANAADGVKQADLQNGTLVITQAEGANHSVSVRHDAPFDDGVIKLRFQVFDKTGLKFNINDPKANKVTWAGHIARVVLTPNFVTISDDKTGVYDLQVRSKRKSKNLGMEEQAELAKFLATKSAKLKAPIKPKEWHEMTMVNIGPKFEVYIDDQLVGSFSSEGLDHKVKQNIALGVSGKVTVDDLRVWSLDQ